MKRVIYLSDKNEYALKEELYLKVRAVENRIYMDEVVVGLPYIEQHSPYHSEWIVRKAGYNKLIRYLGNKNATLSILDIGAGNCWMADKLTGINNSLVTAIDLNSYELEQGARVFSTNNNLRIIYGDIFSFTQDEGFDTIVLAASLQYFKDVKKLVEKLLSLLKPTGVIHIIDTPFYSSSDLEDAKKRSDDYYASLGVLEMSKHYFHHSFEELKGFKTEIIKPNIVEKVFLRITKGQKVFFPWVIVK